MPQLVDVEGTRVLCVSEARGALSQVEELAVSVKAHVVVHVGSFGFFDGDSALNMAPSQLAHVANCSRVVKGAAFHDMEEETLRETVGSQLSELPLFLAGVKRFSVPVYCVYGGCEDVKVVAKFKSGEYEVPNLCIVDEQSAPLVNGTRLRLLGLPGQFDVLKLLNAGDSGHPSLAGDSFSTWATLWQLGELFHTARSNFDPKEIRLFLTETVPADFPMLQYIAILLRADIYISGDRCVKKGTGVDEHSPYIQSYCMSGTGVELSEYLRQLNSFKSGLDSMLSGVRSQVRQQSHPKQLQLVESTAQLLIGPTSPLLRERIEHAYRSLWFFRMDPLGAGHLTLTYSKKHQIALHAYSSGLDFSRRQEERRRDKIEQKRERERKRKERSVDEQLYGLWFRNGDRTTEEVLKCLHEEDRRLHTKVVEKTTERPQGGKSQITLVLFQTQEQASQAYDRVNKDEAGTVSIYQPESQRPKGKH